MLVCPDPDCEERFQSYHDEHAMTTMMRHVKKEHKALFNDFQVFFGIKIGHEYPVGTVFKTLEDWRWRVTDRYVDVDKGGLYYVLEGVEGYANHGEENLVHEPNLVNHFTEVDNDE